MARLPKFKEQEILLRNIKTLVSEFEVTRFKISDIATIGGSQRMLIAENPFLSNKEAILETLMEFEKQKLVKMIDYNEKKFEHNEFEVVIENIGDIKPFKTPKDILKEMNNLLHDYLSNDYPIVREHLRNAERVLFDEAKKDYSEVGHYCQLAYEDFLELICKKFSVNTLNMEKRKTVDRFKLLKNNSKNGEKHFALTEALQHFLGCSLDFNEKVEHRKEETRNSTYEEGKKSLLYTYLIINEIIYYTEKYNK